MNELIDLERLFLASSDDRMTKRSLQLIGRLVDTATPSEDSVDAAKTAKELKEMLPEFVSSHAGEPGNVMMEVFALLHATLATHLSNEVTGMLEDVLELAGHERRGKRLSHALFIVEGKPGDQLSEASAIGETQGPFHGTVDGQEINVQAIWPVDVWKLEGNGKPVAARDSLSLHWDTELPATIDRDEFRLQAFVYGASHSDVESLREAAWKLTPRDRKQPEVSLRNNLGWSAIQSTQSSEICVATLESKETNRANGKHLDCIGPGHWLTWSVSSADLMTLKGEQTDETVQCQIHGLSLPLDLRNRFKDGEIQLIANAVLGRVEFVSGKPVEAEARPLGDLVAKSDNGASLKVFSNSLSVETPAETDVQYIRRASRALRHRGVAVTRQDWKDIVRSVSPMIDICEARDAYLADGADHGKGVLVMYHCSYDPTGELDRILLPHVRLRLESACPLGIKFRIALPSFVIGDMLVDEVCVPNDMVNRHSSGGRSTRHSLNATFARRLLERVDVSDASSDFWRHMVDQYRRGHGPKFDTTEAVDEIKAFCALKLFNDDALQKPGKETLAGPSGDPITHLSFEFDKQNSYSEFCMSLRYEPWPIAKVRRFELNDDLSLRSSF